MTQFKSNFTLPMKDLEVNLTNRVRSVGKSFRGSNYSSPSPVSQDFRTFGI